MSTNMSITRIYHTWEKWECYPAGLYETGMSDVSQAEAQQLYATILRDTKRFDNALHRVTSEWVKSCEHYLTNENMNRIAWLGQAAACIDSGIPRCYRSGFNLLTAIEQTKANNLALKHLNRWLHDHGQPPVNLEEAGVFSKVDLY